MPHDPQSARCCAELRPNTLDSIDTRRQAASLLLLAEKQRFTPEQVRVRASLFHPVPELQYPAAVARVRTCIPLGLDGASWRLVVSSDRLRQAARFPRRSIPACEFSA